MGLVKTKITLRNPRKDHVRPLEVEALADTGAMHMILPPWVAAELELDELDRRTAVVADGRRQVASYQGPLLITFRDRHSIPGDR